MIFSPSDRKSTVNYGHLGRIGVIRPLSRRTELKITINSRESTSIGNFFAHTTPTSPILGTVGNKE